MWFDYTRFSFRNLSYWIESNDSFSPNEGQPPQPLIKVVQTPELFVESSLYLTFSPNSSLHLTALKNSLTSNKMSENVTWFIAAFSPYHLPFYLLRSPGLLSHSLSHSGRHKYFHNKGLMIVWPRPWTLFSWVQFSLNDFIYIESISNWELFSTSFQQS